MLIKGFIVLAILALVLVVSVIRQPEEFRTTRSLMMSAPASVVFAQVNDFHKWEAWSPWAKMDPMVKNSFEGPGSGVGAIYRWEGNSKVGIGNMTLMESHPNDLIRMRLEFLKPFPGVNTTEFTFQPQGNQTLVTWSMFGKNTLPGKVMGVFMNCDKMVGSQFEKGLANMKAIVESKPKA